MQILKSGIAGTLESSDIMITMEPGSGGIEIELKSPVDKQYGRHIRSVISSILNDLKVQNVKVTAVDKGALDCTIQARVKTAVYRAAGQSSPEWRVK
jgi:citrate lyase subunit gamma (acyl carrier protein)